MNLTSLWPKPWQSYLSELQIENLNEISNWLTSEQAEHVVYPPVTKIFHAFEYFDPIDTKVVILGQDPYHQHGQANGLSFSVQPGVKIPPSLRNIFKEIMEDIGSEYPSNGDLSLWAEQGVLLLNSVLTVTSSSPGSHKNKGWENFTDEIIQNLSSKNEHIVFILWGNYAKEKRTFIDSEKHLILESTHPSPLAGKAFFGNHHFSQTNNYLKTHKKKEIDWKLN